ncbi:MAG: hypothetical protein WCK32_00765 [Chlorobiaceae bacterium]
MARIPLVGHRSREVSGSIESWKKVTSFGGYNDDSNPRMFFNEGLVTRFPDDTKTLQDGVSTLDVPFVPDKVYQLLDANGNVVGRFTAMDYYAMTASLYYQEALERAAQEERQQQEPQA